MEERQGKQPCVSYADENCPPPPRMFFDRLSGSFWCLRPRIHKEDSLRRKISLGFLLAPLVLMLVAHLSGARGNSDYPRRPKLVVVLVIDQFRFDYLVRFRPQFVERGFNLLLNGWLFSLLYVITFQLTGAADWWRGVMIGIVHALFVLVVGVSLLPGLHPRMASEEHGPEPNRELEPPGFMAVNYGLRTPAAVILMHALFGAILGGFYQLK